MRFDSAMLAAVAGEMRVLLGSQVRDLWLGGADAAGELRSITLNFDNGTLLIDTHPQRARMHLLSRTPGKQRSAPPTPFIEATRKALRGARLLSIDQPHFDRILRLAFSNHDDGGDERRVVLVVELMERRSNVILLDDEGVIIDALKRLPPFLNRARTVLPHRPYQAPPNDRADPLCVADWEGHFAAAGAHPATAEEVVAGLRVVFNGISPGASDFLRARMAEGATAAQACAAYFDATRSAAAGSGRPVLCEGEPYPFALHADCQLVQGSLSELLEQHAASDGIEQELPAARTALLAHLARREKRLGAQQSDVDKTTQHAAEAETHKLHGQLLLANLAAAEAAARAGQRHVEVRNNWADHDSTESDGARLVRIAIEPAWPASENAARYFSRYKRALKLGVDAPRRRAELEAEASALAAWREAAAAAGSLPELQAVAEASGAGAAPKKALSRTAEAERAARPENKLRHREVEGWTMYLGRSAIENQLLLSKVAAPNDVWLHVRGMSSAHALVKAQKGRAVPPSVLEEAARWVATAGRDAHKMQGELVEVVYAQAKWVRAVKGSPGKVTLGRFETVDVRV